MERVFTLMAVNTTTDIQKRLRSYLNPAIQGKFTSAMLNALAAGDQLNQDNIIAVKPQLFIATATGEFLDRLMAGIGIVRPAGMGISDTLFREMGIAITNTKLVRNIFLQVLSIFYGLDAVQANSLSGDPEGYVLANGMTLMLLVDNDPTPLTITFSASQFTNISDATALEVANAISESAFDSGYTLTAQVFHDATTNENFVQLISGTKGPLSSVTVIGGSAQNILNFPSRAGAVPQGGTQFTTSFVNQYVRFTWTAGPSPQLGFVTQGDYVNIFGQAYLSQNRGTFTIQDVQDGPVGSAYFDIINPNFAAQGPVTLTPVGGDSGGGTASVTSVIAPSPTGAVRSGGTTTITTTTAHGFVAGQLVTIQGVDNSTFNGTFYIISTTTNTFMYSQLGAGASSGGGIASVSYTITPINGAVRVSGVSTITATTNVNLVVGQQITIHGVGDSSFDGTFNITSIGVNYFTYAQNASNDLVFFTPVRKITQEQTRYASVYEVNPQEVVIFLPATTTIIKRSLIGSWHVHGSELDNTFLGSHSFNPNEGFPISKSFTTLTSPIFQGQVTTLSFGANFSEFPNSTGYLVFDFGTANQEGPVRYLGRPSDGSLLIDPAYKFQKTHDVGSYVNLLSSSSPYKPNVLGTDYQAYVTGTASGRSIIQNLLQSLAAAGIFLNIVIVYPRGPGIQDIPNYVYGGDPATG